MDASEDPNRRKNIRLMREDYFGLRAYFITICCEERHKFFADPARTARVIEHLREISTAQYFLVHAYCVMPDHLHMLVGGQKHLRAGNLYGRPGTNASRLRAYGRGGRTCARCGHKLVKVRLAGRGTHYCPHCQKPRRNKGASLRLCGGRRGSWSDCRGRWGNAWLRFRTTLSNISTTTSRNLPNRPAFPIRVPG